VLCIIHFLPILGGAELNIDKATYSNLDMVLYLYYNSLKMMKERMMKERERDFVHMGTSAPFIFV
jgi:hypothetical protein